MKQPNQVIEIVNELDVTGSYFPGHTPGQRQCAVLSGPPNAETKAWIDSFGGWMGYQFARGEIVGYTKGTMPNEPIVTSMPSWFITLIASVVIGACVFAAMWAFVAAL
jgi:hypothetical protein